MVKPGYKQTEIGVIPEDWDIVKLIDLSDGGMQNGVFYAVDRKGKGVRFLNVGNLYGTAPITPQTLERFDATKEEINRFRIKSGDLFFTRSSIVPSGIAYCNWYKDVDDCVTVFDSHVVRFKTDTDKVNPMYLYLQCISHSARRYFISNAKVATMTTIDQSQIGNCLVPIPSSFTEQGQIAQSISDIDNLIVVYEKLLRKKKAIKQGAMKELLTGKKRLPGYATPWVSRKLCDIAPLQRGFDLPYSQLEDGPIPVVFSNGINAHHRVAMVKGPGVITGRSGTIGKLHYVDGDYWPHNTTLWVTDFKGNNPRFVYYLFHLVNWTDYMTGSGVPTLNRNDVHEKVISIPGDVEEQESIAVVLSEVDSEITALEEKLDKYRRVKQGMMQQLLTGKTRLV